MLFYSPTIEFKATARSSGTSRRMVLVVLKVLVATMTLAMGAASDELSRDDFPPEFVFGAATSAYQVEGAANEDGRTPSIFDTFAHANGLTGGDKACDQYHRYKEDVGLMADLGINAYRFSISWSRLIPNGKGSVNPKGLEYYNNLIDELISQGIQPHVTLHHSDIPQALEDEYGGWLSRRVVKDFEAYANVCFREFGERVKYWTTMNEANIFVLAGYSWGNLPPQRCSHSPLANCSNGNSSTEPYIAAHHLLLAHASAASLYRNKYQEKQRGFIGLNILTFGLVPLTKTVEDLNGTERAKEMLIGWFLNPLMFGEYPATMRKIVGSRLPSFTKTESNLVKGSIDFLGLNFYYTFYVRNYKPNSSKVKDGSIIVFEDMEFEFLGLIVNETYTSQIPVTPWGLQSVLEIMKNSYGNLPVYIHENGQLTPRSLSLNDWPRIEYLYAYMKGVRDAMRIGSNVRGYFVWSLLDLFELLGGYDFSFGLYYVNPNDPSLKRQPKLSAKWYSHFLHEKSMDPELTVKFDKNAPIPSLHDVIQKEYGQAKI